MCFPLSDSSLPTLVPKPQRDLGISDREGAYVNVSEEGVQVIVIGPMRYTPGEYAAAVSDLCGAEFGVRSAEFMTCTNADLNHTLLCRGFVSMIFGKVA